MGLDEDLPSGSTSRPHASRDDRQPGQSDADRLAQLTDRFGIIYRTSWQTVLANLPTLKGAGPEETTEPVERGDGGGLAALLEEAETLRKRITVEAGGGPTDDNTPYRHPESEISHLNQGSSEPEEVEPVPEHNSQPSRTVILGDPKPPTTVGTTDVARKTRRCPSCGDPVTDPKGRCATCYIRGGGGPGFTAGGSEAGWWR